MQDVKKSLTDLFPKPATLPPQSIREPSSLGKEDLKLLKELGLTNDQLKETVVGSTQINYERMSLYREIDRAVQHWMMGAAAELFADVATTPNTLHNATVWITAESSEYSTTLNKFLDDINIEEKIFDWAWTLASYGDLFIETEGIPGLGVVHIDDNFHPANMSRVDYKGVLVGFYRTPFEAGMGSMSTAVDAKLLPPWQYVHFRVLGAKKKRPLYGDPNHSEFRSVHLMGPETKQVSSKYGTSLLINGLPIYKRMRLAEDSIMLARLTRGIMKYIYKIKVDGMPDAAASIIDCYTRILKRARALNTDPNNPTYDSKSNPMAVVEDLFIPVWGDAANDVVIEKIGGETDIRWLKDIEELRNQLAAALRCPLALLGAWVKEATGSLGSDAIEQMDIRFSRASRRLQRALINGIIRLCQIHLAYQGMDPDPNLFEVQMGETSTAEEEIQRRNTDATLDTISKFVETVGRIGQATGKAYDMAEIFQYLNEKFMKLNDFDLQSYELDEIPAGMGGEEGEMPMGGSGMPMPDEGTPMGGEAGEMTIDDAGEPGSTEGEMSIPRPRESKITSQAHRVRKLTERLEIQRRYVRTKNGTATADFISALPLPENTQVIGYDSGDQWREDFKEVKVVIGDIKVYERKLKQAKTETDKTVSEMEE